MHRSLLLTVLIIAPGALAAEPPFHGESGPLPAEVVTSMKQTSWREGCPVPLEKLALIRLTHWGTDGEVHEGQLVANAAVADDLVEIFRVLYAKKFPIERMRLIDAYRGDDGASMADNNTSAFNCRWVTGRKGVFSKHAWGRAIDINPLTNPYVMRSGRVLPPGGTAYVDRTRAAPGLITADGEVVAAFTQRGWTWGGSWKRLKDYQHFEKK